MTPETVAEYLAQRGQLRYSRSSGPGGQHRDHAETRVELVVDISAVEGLGDTERERVVTGLSLDRAPLRIVSQRHRSRERNRVSVIRELERRVALALAPPSAPRRATRPGRAARQRRLENKRRRSATKRLRRAPGHD